MVEKNGNDRGINDARDDSVGAPESAHGYRDQAARALEQGDAVLAMHLYLAAYEESAAASDGRSIDVKALRAAWRLACELKERSIAEYVYDKLEPYVTQAESDEMSAALQDLALDHLSEFGISRADLEDMADMISDELASARGFMADIIDLNPSQADDVTSDEDAASDDVPADAASDVDGVHGAAAESSAEGEAADAAADAAAKESGIERAANAIRASLTFGSTGTSKGSDTVEPAKTSKRPTAAKGSDSTLAAGSKTPAGTKGSGAAKASTAAKGAGSAKHSDKDNRKPSFGFDDLVGYDSVIEDLRSLGIGLSSDSESFALIEKLRAAHGLEKLSAVGSIVLRTSSREDASQVMAAAAGELQMPMMRVQMQDGPQGVPVLYITSTSDRQLRFGNSGHMAFPSPSVVLLEDVDLWGGPLMSAAADADSDSIAYASAVRAARQATIFIRTVVENPDVYVLASVGGDADGQGYLYDLLAPTTVVEVYLPDEIDRRRIWNAIAHNHPSVRALDLDELTRLSANLSRTDIVAAAHETIEEAYREGLRQRAYVPITQEAAYAHLANYQPLVSDEYRQLEAAVLKQFHESLATFDDDVAAEADRQKARLTAADGNGSAGAARLAEGAKNPDDEISAEGAKPSDDAKPAGGAKPSDDAKPVDAARGTATGAAGGDEGPAVDTADGDDRGNTTGTTGMTDDRGEQDDR
jgi:hypothetical protein